VRLLLDTHTFLWFIGDDSRLSSVARNLIEDESNEIVLSIASLWEMAIKISLGKLQLATPFEEFIPAQLTSNGITLLNITVPQAAGIIALPFHHRDPFDRLLISQAVVERIPIVSADVIFDAYPVTRLW
jgi:PIN domain nuclease of toxin-antitoxin system